MKSIPSSVWFLGSLLLGALFIGALVFTANKNIRDNVNLPIQIVEYFDYRCSHCSDAYPEVKEIKKTYGDKVEIIPRHYPLPVGENSYELAYGAEAARAQNKFDEYHNEVFERMGKYLNNQLDVSEIDPYKIAAAIKLDMGKFGKDIQDKELMAKVDEDKKRGGVLGVTGTPTFFVEGQRVNGAILTQTVDDLVRLAEQNAGK
jgi:protein-disulfide isomerase